MVTFKVGKTYYTRSIGDYDCIYEFTIYGRTAKSIRTNIHGGAATRKITLWDGVETFKPFGTYSMCAVICADKEKA